MFFFYTSLKRQKTAGLLAFSGVIKMKHWLQMGYYDTYLYVCTNKTIDLKILLFRRLLSKWNERNTKVKVN